MSLSCITAGNHKPTFIDLQIQSHLFPALTRPGIGLTLVCQIDRHNMTMSMTKTCCMLMM